ncbi:MAG: hypothetical protein RMK89_09365 [Armatimonadota bacterium]|nr:hypothetical protein [Armatimonadota bacterium]MDW8143655.1 hypothetical protein [Armatimonadota bacterium]
MINLIKDMTKIAKKHKFALFVITIVFAGIVYYIHLITLPYQTLKNFITAVENENVKDIVYLAVAEERKFCGVTEQSVKAILDATLGRWRPFKAVRIEKVPWERVPVYKELGWHRWLVVWGDAVSGKPIPFHSSGRGYPAYGITSPQLFTEIDVRPTDEGWRVLVTGFLIQLTYGVYGLSEYLSILHRSGIKGEVNVLTKPGEFRPLPKP